MHSVFLMAFSLDPKIALLSIITWVIGSRFWRGIPIWICGGIYIKILLLNEGHIFNPFSCSIFRYFQWLRAILFLPRTSGYPPEWAKTVTHTQRKYTERDTPAEDANPAAGRLLKALGLSNLNAVYPASCAGWSPQCKSPSTRLSANKRDVQQRQKQHQLQSTVLWRCELPEASTVQVLCILIANFSISYELSCGHNHCADASATLK